MTTTREVIGRTFRLRVDLHAHIAAHPVVATAGPAERPAIEACPITLVLAPRARPAAVDLDIAGRLLIDSSRRLEHRLHIGGMADRCQREKRERASETLPQRH